jgi:flagellar basal-body rod protein FlgG
MFRSLQVAATGMTAQETMLDTIANNLANANTTGYKAQSVEFEDLIYQSGRTAGPIDGGAISPTSVQVGSGSRVVATTRSFSQGAMQQTGNPLDIAVEGSGFLAVMQPSGQLAYTRAGSLKLDAQGRLSTSNGLIVEPPVTVPANATAVTIGPNGAVSITQPNQTTPTTVGQLQLTMFSNPNGLNSIGHNLFEPTGSSGEPLTGAPGANGAGTILQGSLESSNVDVVSEMVNLIGAQRAYEINSKVVSAADQMLQNATQMR